MLLKRYACTRGSVTAMNNPSFVRRTEGGQLSLEMQDCLDGTHDRPRVGIIDPSAQTPIRFPLKVGAAGHPRVAFNTIGATSASAS
jgi:hypothetical protein